MAPRPATKMKQQQKLSSKSSKSKPTKKALISPDMISNSGSEDMGSSDGDSFIDIDAEDNDDEDYDE
jgi:hypothetical protein